jgi:Tol biopolymer transport system component
MIPAHAQKPLGIFTGQSDVGTVMPPGTTAFDPKAGTYTISSPGGDLWAAEDDFHFVWKKVSGDISLTADIKVAQNDPAAHPLRKAFLMFRESLDTDAKYVDAAVHGNGEVALQYRRAKGGRTGDIAFNNGAPQRIRLEKHGDTFTLFISMTGEPLHPAGATMKVPFSGEFYVGLGVCAHDARTARSATFSNIAVAAVQAPAASIKMAWFSTLQTIETDPAKSGIWVVRTSRARMEAPNYSRDGKSMVYTSGGAMFSVPATGGEPTRLDVGKAFDCTGSHGLSADGKLMAITCQTPDHPGRRVYIVSAAGGEPRLLTETPNSYFHGWSPDGQTIAFTRPNPGGGGNILGIPVQGGAEKALTTGAGVSDDPDYSPDGQWIYFNSDRGGSMQIWRMKPDGSQPEQITHDDRPNWTPHPSPDGKSILILSYPKGVTGHPTNTPAALRLLDVATGNIRDLAEITGGGGSDNVNNWSPDSAHIAFVSYQLLPDPDGDARE